MNYRKNIKTNDEISLLGFGCMRFPTKSGKIDVQESIKMLEYAIDNGVNYIDTAYPYHSGESEKFLGKYLLNGKYRDKVKVATKLPSFLIRKESDIDKYFNRQYDRLGVETVDYYLLHTLDKSSYDNLVNLNVHQYLETKQKENKIGRIGFSFHGSISDFKYIIDSYDWDFCQIQLNIIDENFQAGLEGLNYAYEKGVSVIIMEPLRGGSLVNSLPKTVSKLYEESDKNYNNVEWAFKYLYNNPKVMCVLSGMSSIEQVKENVAIASNSDAHCLDETDLELLNEVKDEFLKGYDINCTGCGYCIDCPVKIDIPYAFKTHNSYKMYKKNHDLFFYVKIVGLANHKPRWTTTCIDCGKCEEHCPQFLEIRKDFKKVQQTIERSTVRRLTSAARFVMRIK